MKHICSGFFGPATALGQNVEQLLLFECLKLFVIIQLHIVKPDNRVWLRGTMGTGRCYDGGHGSTPPFA
jgi:hypothetical protein